MTDEQAAVPLLLGLLDGATFANAMRRNGTPCPIRLPDDPGARAALVDAHLRGTPANLTFDADRHSPWDERVDAVSLATFCPAADGRCRWIGIDLDGADHGERGLADPVHAVRTIAERAASAGLNSGLLVARSRRGRGRHVFLIPAEPATLADAVVGVAALAAAAFKIAASDVAQYGAQHAFRCADGAVARPGDAGSVELLPRSTARPRHGWALALPGAGAFAARGGGVIVDPLSDQPIHHECVPRCDQQAWSCFVEEARMALSKRDSASDPQHTRRFANGARKSDRRIDPRTEAFLEGRIPEGTRNNAAFAATANLLGCGVDEPDALRLIMVGADACGLPPREAMSAFRSAARAVAQRQRRT